MADDEAKKAKQAEIERKRAEVRKRMEEASKAKKAKKGFMTPERKKKLRISDLNAQVNDLRGKFVKPTLKKVSKYENKFAKLQKKAAEFNFRNQLKVVKKKEFTLEEEDKEAKKSEKADWQKK
uniref:Troponin I n=1 Tax=Anopheles merus TaxID=30066 RepID=A0A182VIG7_ANOME